MSNPEKMTIDERRKYLKRMQARYRRADREKQSALLDEMEVMTELHRKSLIRLMQAENLDRQPRRVQRGLTYDYTVDEALRILAETSDYVCAERLKPALPWLADNLAAHRELHLTAHLRELLEAISISTLRRRLARLTPEQPRLPRKHPTGRSRLAQEIPMGRIPWDEATPGHWETDLVHHSGPSTHGDYVHTLQLIDVATGWSERVAIFGRSQRAMEAGFRRIMVRLPFPILEIHPDNGSEFLNDHLVRFFRDKVKGVQLSRSRPYQKNDNRFVEQKNHTLVRAFFGDVRFDTLAHQKLLEQLYDQMWWYYNFFQPVLHLTEKQRIEQEGQVRYRRKWDEAQTPFERLCATPVLKKSAQMRLRKQRDAINPRRLRKEIYDLRDRLFDLPLASAPSDTWLIPPDEDE